MSLLKLTGGYYTSRSLPAAAQRCQNLYPEATPPSAGEAISYWDYLTPGLILHGTAPSEQCRCAYTASNGDLYMVFGQTLYYVDPSFNFNPVGVMAGSTLQDIVPRWTPVYIADNGVNLLIVDGTTDGWTVLMATRASFTRINIAATALSILSVTMNTVGAGYSAGDILTIVGTGGAQLTVNSVDVAGGILNQNVTNGGAPVAADPNAFNVTGGTGTGASVHPDFSTIEPNAGFLGSPLVTYQDSFFILSRPNTNQFYISASEDITFDPLDFASKNANADNIVGVLSCHRVIWIVGTASYEVWANNGGGGTIVDSFPFSLIPSAYANWGCIAPGSFKTANNEIYWLSRDNTGKGIVLQGQSDYNVKRISTSAIENVIRTYPRLDDAIAFIYTQSGHPFYFLTFPSANDYRGATWCFDSSTNLWHERVFTDLNGLSWRHRISYATNAYDTILGGDWATSSFYELSLESYTDNGFPIVRLRSFPHNQDTQGQRRVSYRQLTLWMETGTSTVVGDILVPLVAFTATATDGTLLQNYANVNDINANFTKISGVNAEIVNNAVVGQTNGTDLYQINIPPPIRDYQINFKISLTSFIIPENTNDFFVIARADDIHNGYKVSVSSDGTAIFLSLAIMGTMSVTTLELGALSADYYTIFMTLEGSEVTVSAYRAVDNLWLSNTGAWLPNQTVAISIFDTTYPTAGTILLGGTWLTT